MALPTPPNSTKETLHHTFGGDETSTYSPLFDSFALHNGPPSPTAKLFGDRFSATAHYFQRSPIPAQQPKQQDSYTSVTSIPKPTAPAAFPRKRARSQTRDMPIVFEPESFAPMKRHRIDSFNVANDDDNTSKADSDPALFESGRAISESFFSDDDDAEEFSAADFMTLSDLQLAQALHPQSPIYLNVLRVCLDDTGALRDRIRRVRGVSPPTRTDTRALMNLKHTVATLTTPETKSAALSSTTSGNRRMTSVTPAPAPKKHEHAKSLSGSRSSNKKVTTAVNKTLVPKDEQEYTPNSGKSRPAVAPRHRRPPQTNASPAKGEIKTTRNPANKPAVSKRLEDWPDYAPSASVLDGARSIADAFPRQGGRDLKDYSQYEHFDKLHPVEVIITQQASVDPSRYLVTKRSVFVGYLKYLLNKKGRRPLTASEESNKGLKSWNKTAAQNCSSIDVNKTSALFEHFWMKAGLFDEKHFQRYVDHPELAVFPEFDKEGNLIH